jgi:hypothetical protein
LSHRIWRTEVFLSDKAFLGINISCIEVFPNECHGSLLGYNTRGRFVIEYAFPYQSAKRKPTEVEPNWRRELKVRGALEKMTELAHIGYFHSHTQWGQAKASLALSDSDKRWMKPGQIEIVVAVDRAKRRTGWSSPKNGVELSGSISGYHIRMAGWYKRKTAKTEIVQYPIRCPYALGFGYAFT